MSIKVDETDAPEGIIGAAWIWSGATARRDGLQNAVDAEGKLPGLRSALQVPGATLHVATHESTEVGFVLLVPSGPMLEVRYLGVAPTSWGQGIGALLLDVVRARAQAGGFDAAELWVLEDNERAIDVYVRVGWVLTPDVKSQIDTRRIERRLELQVR